MTKTMPILLIEDDEIDVEALTRAFTKQKLDNEIYRARDGVEALEMLKTVPQPCLMIIDINMPRMNGLDLLEIVHQDDQLRKNVVIVLTTSSRNDDKIRAYESRVSGYFLKENLNEFAQMIGQYCRINELPGRDNRVTGSI